MKRKISLGMTVFLVLLAAVTSCALTLAIVPNSISAFFGRDIAYSKLLQIEKLVETNFYDYDNVDRQELADKMAEGYMSGLDDKYSCYFSADQNDSIKLANDGGGVGIGATVVQHPDTGNVYVVTVSPDSPSGRAGIVSGDQITAVGGVSITELGYEKAVGSLQGEVGDTVTLTVLHDGITSDYTLTRAQFTVCSVFSHMIGTVGYIRITTFNSATVDQFAAAVSSMQQQGATGLIFDLRNNYGGTVESTEKILDLLLPEGTVLSAEYAGNPQKVLYTSDASEIDLPMAVLINKNTASAAELFAAAVRDFQKGVLVGNQSYGKGVMQHTFNLSDGSAVRITVAKFNPPSGVNFNGIGLAPDIEATFTQEQQQRVYLLSDSEDPYIIAAENALTK